MILLFFVLLSSTIVDARDDCGKRCVGILYETWFNQLKFPLLPIYPTPNPTNTYRCWGEPAIGTYYSDNRTVAEIHAEQMFGAGIDYIVVDYSNSNILNSDLNGPLMGFLQLYKARRIKMMPTPRVTFLIPADETQLEMLWNDYYETLNAPDVFMYWEGKPLLLTLGNCTLDICDNFTWRDTWALRPQGGKWSFMDLYPQPFYVHDNVPEQMAVAAAQQETWMSAQTAHGRNYDYRSGKNDGLEGQNFADQFQRAIDTKVRTILVKSWNEWCSIRTKDDLSPAVGGGYTDEFNSTYSNDIEPMSGGHGDMYLRLLTEHINAFKRA